MVTFSFGSSRNMSIDQTKIVKNEPGALLGSRTGDCLCLRLSRPDEIALLGPSAAPWNTRLVGASAL